MNSGCIYAVNACWISKVFSTLLTVSHERRRNLKARCKSIVYLCIGFDNFKAVFSYQNMSWIIHNLLFLSEVFDTFVLRPLTFFYWGNFPYIRIEIRQIIYIQIFNLCNIQDKKGRTVLSKVFNVQKISNSNQIV